MFLQKYNDAFQLLLNAFEGNDEGTKDNKDSELMSDFITSTKNDKSLSRKEIIAQLITFLFAGYETTATTLHFICYILSFKEDVQDQMRDEITTVLNGKENIEYDDLTNFKYLDKVISETLRMYPPLTRNTRLCQNDVIINGIQFKKGTMIAFNVYDIHHNPDIYENPEEFDPNRFSPENKKERHPLAYMPWGSGPRICLGMRFAEFTMKIALIELLKNYKLSAADGMPGIKVDIQSVDLIRPVIDLKCKIDKI